MSKGVVALIITAALLAAGGAAGGQSRALRASVDRVAWAPGASILFSRSSNIGPEGAFIYTRSGPRRLFREAGEPDWSPDGTLIALDYRSGIATVRPDGGGLRIVGRNIVQPHWSPDGRWIAFFFVFRNGVGIMRPDGSGVRQVGILRSDAPDRIAWSPDSRRLVFGAEDKGFFVVPIDGSERQRPRRVCPEWGPHGELVYRGKDVITIVRPGGSSRRLRLSECPTWSPDGSRVAANGRVRPVIASVRTGRRWPVRVTPRADAAPDLAWSPDGRRLAFSWPTGAGETPPYGLYSVGATGGRPRQLTR